MRTLLSRSARALLATLIFSIAACAAEGLGDGAGGEGSMADEVTDLETIFSQAGEEFGVPADLLAAIGYVETRWQMVEGTQEFDTLEPAYGVMALRGDRLARGASALGVSEDDVRFLEEANIRAAAALLDEYAADLGIDRSDLGAWAPAVARYSGIEDPEAQAEYVVEEVYGVLNEGARLKLEDGRVVAEVGAGEVKADFPAPPEPVAAAAVDYANAVWRGSPNYNDRPSGSIGDVVMLIIHTCEGSYTGCWSWLSNSAAGASAHYVVNKSGSEVSQLVREQHRAWHIAANYDCGRNGDHDCGRNGYSTNHFSVGIEHAGYASQSSFPSGQIEASAKLACDITEDHGIPRDRYHIVGHGQLQPWNRTDPGANWPWTHYINRVRAHCGDGGGSGGGSGGGEIVIDSNNANNDDDVAYVEVSDSWVASNSTSGYYGTGYWWSSTRAVSDGASFWFYLPQDGTRTVDAWWTEGANRSTGAPFVAFDADGNVVGKAYENQQANGSSWVKLGTWNFKKGWNRIVVSRWAPKGSVVVADALRVR